MDIDEIIEEIRKHNEHYPKHRVDCSCMDEFAIKLYQIIAEQEVSIKNRLRLVLRLALAWDEMRKNT